MVQNPPAAIVPLRLYVVTPTFNSHPLRFIGTDVGLNSSIKNSYEVKCSVNERRVHNFNKIAGGEIHGLKVSIDRASKSFMKKIKNLTPENGWSLSFVRERYDAEIKKAKQALNSLKEQKKELEEVLKKSNEIQ